MHGTSSPGLCFLLDFSEKSGKEGMLDTHEGSFSLQHPEEKQRLGLCD